MIFWTSSCRTTSFSSKYTIAKPGMFWTMLCTSMRPDIGRHFFFECARQESERLAGFHRGPAQDDAADFLLAQRVHRERHREVGLAGPGRADADHDIVVADGLNVIFLANGFRRDWP